MLLQFRRAAWKQYFDNSFYAGIIPSKNLKKPLKIKTEAKPWIFYSFWILLHSVSMSKCWRTKILQCRGGVKKYRENPVFTIICDFKIRKLVCHLCSTEFKITVLIINLNIPDWIHGYNFPQSNLTFDTY